MTFRMSVGDSLVFIGFILESAPAPIERRAKMSPSLKPWFPERFARSEGEAAVLATLTHEHCGDYSVAGRGCTES